MLILKNKTLGRSLYEKSKKYQRLLNIPYVDISYKQTKNKKKFLLESDKAKKTMIKYVDSNMLSTQKIPGYMEILNYLDEQSSC